MRVLVTGGGGFIGSHLVERLLHEGCEVRVLDNFATGRRSNLVPMIDDIELVEGDLRSYELVLHAVQGCEIVFHQAALPSVPRSIQDPLTTSEVNAQGTLKVLMAAREADVRRVVYASSSSVYGSGPGLPRREALPTAPASPYAVSKLAGEGYCASFGEVYGLESVALRYFNVFGTRQDPLSQYAAVIPNFITAMLGGRPPQIFGDGEQSRDFTHVENVVDVNILAMRSPGIGGRVYNVGCGEAMSVNQLVAHLNRLLGTGIEPAHMAPRAGEVRCSFADIERASRELGYSPRVPVQDGLAMVVESYRREADVRKEGVGA